MRTTVRYGLSLPTTLEWDGSATVFSSKAATWNKELAWPPEPVWAESDWPLSTPLVRITLRESEATERTVGTAGLLVFSTFFLLCWWLREERLNAA